MIDLDNTNTSGRPSVPTDDALGRDMMSLMKSVRRIVRASDLGSRSLQKSSGLTAPQLAVLTAVGGEGEISTTRIASHVELSAATVVTILDNLERQGLVTRHRSSEDRRIVFTRLTEGGAALLARAHGPFGDAFANAVARLPLDRRDRMVEAVALLADLMTASGHRDGAGPRDGASTPAL